MPLYSQDEPKPEEFDTVMTLTDFWEIVFSNDTIDVVLEDIYVETKDSKEHSRIENQVLTKKKTVNKSITISGVYFRGYFNPLYKQYLSPSSIFDSTTFLKPVEIYTYGNQGILIHNCIFKQYAAIGSFESSIGIFIDNSYFESGFHFSALEEENAALWIKNSSLRRSSHESEWISNFSDIRIKNSSFLNSPGDTSKYNGIFIQDFDSELNILEIDNSYFEVPLYSRNTKIKSHLNFHNSKFSFIGFNTFKMPDDPYEFRSKWSLLDSSFSYTKETVIPHSVDGRFNVEYKYYNLFADSSIIDIEIHDNLKSKAYQLLKFYKAQGDLKSYNTLYKDIKIFENKRLKFEYKNEPTFEGWFHWKLNELISAYSDYGTNPAKAVIKSLWVILLFTFFYMFFPSEWDISSKAVIIANFKRIRDKNDKTTSPFLKAIAHLLVSFINAFTLSINAFITLGFGHIPTKGVARYMTILQGFIGWFLLTIFSVSLISQVLN